MKKILFLVAAIIACSWYFSNERPGAQTGSTVTVSGRNVTSGDDIFAEAYANHRSHLRVSGEGTVVQLLPDDNKGSRHQRFILQLSSGQTLLIAHNIDIAPKIGGLRPGDLVQFCGDYEWNAQGGVIHWTHRDPNGSHPAGCLVHQGRTYW
jgi:hypothetical protein